MKISKFLCAAFVSAALTGCCGTHLSTEEVHQFNLNQDTEAVVKTTFTGSAFILSVSVRC